MIYEFSAFYFAEDRDGIYAVETCVGVNLRVQETLYDGEPEGVLMAASLYTDTNETRIYEGDVLEKPDGECVTIEKLEDLENVPEDSRVVGNKFQ